MTGFTIRRWLPAAFGQVILGAALFVVTGAGVWLASAPPSAAHPTVAPPRDPVVALVPQQRPRVEVVFVLDTTSSMSGLIASAKEKIWSVASSMAQARPAPEIKMGLVAYRDRGDAYVTQVYDLSSDLDSMYAQLMDFRAEGGGDGPESVNQAVHDAVNKISWSPGQDAYKVIFLVGDAPPHMDYQNDVPYTVSVNQALQLGIVVNTIQCGTVATTTPTWQSIAQLGRGEYFQVEQNGGAVAVTTPFDAKIASLAEDLDATRLYYGTAADRAAAEKKTAAAAKLYRSAPAATLAQRAQYNLSASGRDNLLGKNELVDAVSSGEVALEGVAKEELPAALRDAEPEMRQRQVQELAQKRADLKSQLVELQEQRSAYLKETAAVRPAAPAAWDYRVLEAVKTQAAEKGLKYAPTDAPVTKAPGATDPGSANGEAVGGGDSP